MAEWLLTLATWLSPSYPVGAFAYSHGLETAIADGAVRDADGARGWIADCVSHGAGRTDAMLLAAAYRAPQDDAVAALALALAPSAERRLETEAQGTAFAATTAAAWGAPAAGEDAGIGEDAAIAYPVAVGRAAAAHAVPLEAAAEMYVHAFASALIGAATRLIPLGQTEGQAALAALAPVCRQAAAEAIAAELSDIGGCAVAADIASMRHETLQVRLFRS